MIALALGSASVLSFASTSIVVLRMTDLLVTHWYVTLKCIDSLLSCCYY